MWRSVRRAGMTGLADAAVVGCQQQERGPGCRDVLRVVENNRRTTPASPRLCDPGSLLSRGMIGRRHRARADAVGPARPPGLWLPFNLSSWACTARLLAHASGSA